MSRFFVELFNISITAGWLIAAVLVIRLLFKKIAPKWAVCLLWALVGIRLALPFSIESDLSLVPSKGFVNTDTVYSDIVQDNNLPDTDQNINNEYNPIPDQQIPQQKPQTPPQYVDSGFGAIDDKINGALNSTPQAENPIKAVADKAWIVWACGCIGLFGYAVINYILLRKRVGEFISNGEGIRRSGNVGSPFILGIIKPKIYLPLGLSDETEAQVIAHEKAHLKRRDHLIKPFGYLLLCIYWFNPLIWIAYILLCRDIEMACDEKVVKNMNAEARKLYATALLECGVQHSRIAACPLAFGEIGVKQRVKNALNYKKPLFWIIIASVIVCVAVAVFFLTNPTNDDTATDDEASQNSQDISDTSSESSVGGADSDVSIDVSVNPKPEVSEPEVSEPEVSEPEPEEPHYSGKIYTYTVPGPNRRAQHFDAEDYVKDKILTLINTFDWQDKNVNYDYDYLIMVGDGTKAKKLYYNSQGFISDETDDRFALLTVSQAAYLNAYLRFPEPEPPYGVLETVTLTVAENTFAKLSVYDSYFYAKDKAGVMHKVYWSDCDSITEGCTVEADIWAVADAGYGDITSYEPKNVLHAVDLRIISKPKEESVPQNGNIKFNQWISSISLTEAAEQKWQTEAAKYGKNSNIWVIKSLEELNGFLNNLQLSEYGSISDFEYYAERIPADYFKENTLLLTYAWSPELLTRYNVTNVNVKGKDLTLSITAPLHEDYSPEREQHVLIITEVSKAQTADCTSFKVNTTVIEAPQTQPLAPQSLEIVDDRFSLYYSYSNANRDVFVITNRQQAEALKLICDNNHSFENAAFYTDESFFDGKAAVCFGIISSSGGDKSVVTGVEVSEGNILTITVDKYAIGHTGDVYGYMHYVVIDKAIAENIEGCDLIINTIEPDYGEDWEWPD